MGEVASGVRNEVLLVAIRHSEKHASMKTKEWRSIDAIALSTIRDPFSTSSWPRRWQLSCYGRNCKRCTKRSSLCRNSSWFDNYSTWRWESQIQQPPTSTLSIGCCLNFPPKGLASKKKLKLVPSYRPCRRVGRSSVWHSPIVFLGWIQMKQSVKSSLRIFGENRWNSPSMSR